MAALTEAASRIKFWRDNPTAFVREHFGIEPDDWQVDFLESYNTKPRIAARACKGPGKTAVLAWCAWHFITTRPYPKVVATSISGDNLSDGLWAEMAKWQDKSPFLKAAFKWTKTRIFAVDHPETWFMSARQWSKSADKDQQANTLAGIHADYVLFIIDEAGGVPQAVAAAAEAALSTGIETKMLMCGNPTHLDGPLYRACTLERSYWHVITITGDPDDPKRSKRISVEWARKQIAAYGRDNAWVKVNVFGEFPPSSMNALVSPDEVRAAMERHVQPAAYIQAPKILGGDIARSLGLDRSVYFPRQGCVLFKPLIMRVPDLVQVAAQGAQAINKWQPDAVFIDSTGGFGASVVDNLNSWGYSAQGVHFASKATNNQFKNIRAEMAFKLAQWIKEGGCLPNMPELMEECCAQEYFFSKDQVQIIEKDQIKEKLGRSPDLFDAAMLTFAFPVTKRNLFIEMLEAKHGNDYDPLHRGYDFDRERVDYNPIA